MHHQKYSDGGSKDNKEKENKNKNNTTRNIKEEINAKGNEVKEGESRELRSGIREVVIARAAKVKVSSRGKIEVRSGTLKFKRVTHATQKQHILYPA